MPFEQQSINVYKKQTLKQNHKICFLIRTSSESSELAYPHDEWILINRYIILDPFNYF